MFDPGTKVILVESSLHKSVGPRRGSIGYVSNCRHIRVVPVITEGFGSFSVAASLCEILFIRFGFEERGRIERKTVISVFPMMRNGSLLNKEIKKEANKEDNPDIAKHMKDFCHMISSQKDSYLWENVKGICDVSPNIPIVLAAPLSYDTTDLTVCSELEFKAWLASHLTNISISEFIGRTMQSGHYTKYNDKELNKSETWNNLYRLTGDREFRGDFIKLQTRGIEERKECVFLIRKMVAALSHTYLKKVRSAIEEIQFMSKLDFLSACYDIMGPYLYNKIVVSLFEKTLRDFHVSETSKIADDFMATTTEIFSLSDNMLSSNNGFGYTSLNSK
jgi:hypothetical protein